MSEPSSPAADATGTHNLKTWDVESPGLRAWSDADLLAALAELGVSTSKDAMLAEAEKATRQSDVEDDWLERAGDRVDDNTRPLVWMAVQELWERWSLPQWPADRLARMTVYLIDADFSVQWADNFHAPTISQVLDALDQWLAKQANPRAEMDSLMEAAELPAAAWPTKFLDAIAEWAEIGNHGMSLRGADTLAKALGQGHAFAYLAAALISARMMERAQAAALQVPADANLDAGFSEMVAYLCLAAGAVVLADHWLARHDAQVTARKSEMTFAIEAVRDHIAAWRQGGRQDGEVVPDKVRAAARQAASWSSFYVIMAFSGTGVAGGQPGPAKKAMADY